MTEREIELLYKDNAELIPPPELKEKILIQANAEMGRKEGRKSTFSFRNITKRLMPIAACVLFIVMLIGGIFGFSNEQYQTVYIDVNPSVAVHVNRFGNVSDVEYFNEDAKEALEGIKLKGLAVEKAFEKMIDAYDRAGYFNGEAEIYISAVSKKNKNPDKILKKLSKKAEEIKGERGYSVNVSKLTAEDKSEAKEYGISPGKYRVILEIIEKNPQYTVEDLKEKSMAELKAMLSSKDKEKK